MSCIVRRRSVTERLGLCPMISDRGEDRRPLSSPHQYTITVEFCQQAPFQAKCSSIYIMPRSGQKNTEHRNSVPYLFLFVKISLFCCFFNTMFLYSGGGSRFIVQVDQKIFSPCLTDDLGAVQGVDVVFLIYDPVGNSINNTDRLPSNGVYERKPVCVLLRFDSI